MNSSTKPNNMNSSTQPNNMNRSIQPNKIAPVKTSFFSWKFFSWKHIIIIIILIAIIVYVVKIIFTKPASPSLPPGPSLPPVPTACKTSKDCASNDGYICDSTNKCSNALVPHGTNPTTSNAISEASWRGGDLWTMTQIRNGQPFLLRSTRSGPEFCYWYYDGSGSFYNALASSSSTILPANFVFNFTPCPQNTIEYSEFHGFIQPTSDNTKTVQCVCDIAGCTCSIHSFSKTGANACVAGDTSWQVLKIENMPAGWANIPSIMGQKSGNAITSSSSTGLIITALFGGGASTTILGTSGGSSVSTNINNESARSLFQVAFINSASQSYTGKIVEEILSGIFE